MINNLNKSGMSLIVLVITIIVMITLAGVVVMGLSDNNPIEKAREAKLKSMASAVKDDFNLFCSTMTAKMGTVIDISLLEANSDNVTYEGKKFEGYDTIYKILPSLEKNNKDFVVTKGKLLYVSDDERNLDYIDDLDIEMLYRPSLIVEPKEKEDYIHLEWAVIDTSEAYQYKVYQKTEEREDFQTVSTTDFNSTDEVRVLNIYPVLGSEETFTNYEGQTFTLPASARLKRWMEEPKEGYPKGYGKGIIKVDSVYIDEFNKNYDSYLRKVTSQKWTYDVIMIGSWDSNGFKDLNSDSVKRVSQFISAGGGFLSGHDTIGYLGPLSEMRSISRYLNL